MPAYRCPKATPTPGPGICIQDGVILITVFKQNIGKNMLLDAAIYKGVTSRIRPVLMTAMMAAIGLFPAAISTGIGSQTQKPLAIVVIGGLLTATVLTRFVFPLIFERTHGEYRRRQQAQGAAPNALLT